MVEPACRAQLASTTPAMALVARSAAARTSPPSACAARAAARSSVFTLNLQTPAEIAREMTRCDRPDAP